MTWCSRWSQPLDGNLPASRTYPYPDALLHAHRGLVIDDYCRHDDVNLDADTNQHLIECNQCGRWWRCYGDVQDVWRDFLKYGRMDDSDPPTVNIVCSSKAWPTSEKETVQATYIGAG
jgi:hypothetical protein